MSGPATGASGPPPDAVGRDRIVAALEETLFVSAGAGSGKTTALVARTVELVITGTAELARIAAITFTEKAGAELRDRIRVELEARLRSLDASDPDDAAVATRCRTALQQLDGAAIGTLHAFAARLLTEHPIEAGLPPRIEVLDEVSSETAFDRRWTTWRDQLLADPTLEEALRLLIGGSGMRVDALRAVAAAFDDNWDLVAERVLGSTGIDDRIAVDWSGLEELADELDALSATRARCRTPDDLLARRLEELAGGSATLRSATTDAQRRAALAAIAAIDLSKRLGRRESWDLDLEALRRRVSATRRDVERLSNRPLERAVAQVGRAVGRFCVDAAQARRAAGQLDFHDLLVLARDLLRDRTHGAAVRARLHERYQRLLLDEFQDTDPIQIELAVRIAAADPSGPEAGSAPWQQVAVAPGRLFLVGDPKQSIYRFRRADITTFLQAATRFGGSDGATIELTANFRSPPAVIDWVNHTFAALMDPGLSEGSSATTQAPYIPLQAVRPDPPRGPAVAVIGRAAHAAGGADELRAAEAADVAATILRAMAEGWSVAAGDDGWRHARLGDIAVLVPARTSLPFLEEALERAGIAARAEASSLVYATRSIRDLFMVLRAVDDPNDRLRILAALRTPLLGCADDDLFRFRVERGGHWGYLTEQPLSVPSDDPVRAALEHLRRLHDEQRWRTPSELLDRIARETRAFELGIAEQRARDVWRRLRFVIDQARAWSEATGGGLRRYLDWVDRQGGEGSRVVESILPETDDDAVRIMTIHASKGLEFPITIVSGLSSIPRSAQAGTRVLWPPTGAVGYRVGAGITNEEYDEWAPVDEQMAAEERIRLLYVATTRAADHLVVSLHRKARAGTKGPEISRATNAELLVRGMGTHLDAVPDALDGVERAARPVPVTPGPPPPPSEWAARRAAVLARSSRPGVVAATALSDTGTADPAAEPEWPPAEIDPGLRKRPRDLDLPPWMKGRYGTAVGRAVHGVLQTVDLATGRGLDDAVAAQCEAEAVPERAREVRDLVRAALAAPLVRAAAIAPHWREVYACAPVGGRMVEGYVDLLYRSPDGLVVADYKTAATTDAAELADRVARYRRQGASYALAVAASTGETVCRVVFVFLTPGGAVEIAMDDLDRALAEVEAAVTSGQEVVVG